MYSRLRSHQPPSSDADVGDPGPDPKFSAAACPSPGQLPVMSEATPTAPARDGTATCRSFAALYVRRAPETAPVGVAWPVATASRGLPLVVRPTEGGVSV